MSKLIISLIIGAIAGIIDLIPMIIQKTDRYANISAFIQWIVLGVFISYIQMPVPPWVKGIIIAEMSVLPIVIIVSKSEPKSIVPILIMSAILGALVGFATAKFT